MGTETQGGSGGIRAPGPGSSCEKRRGTPWRAEKTHCCGRGPSAVASVTCPHNVSVSSPCRLPTTGQASCCRHSRHSAEDTGRHGGGEVTWSWGQRGLQRDRCWLPLLRGPCRFEAGEAAESLTGAEEQKRPALTALVSRAQRAGCHAMKLLPCRVFRNDPGELRRVQTGRLRPSRRPVPVSATESPLLDPLPQGLLWHVRQTRPGSSGQ